MVFVLVITLWYFVVGWARSLQEHADDLSEAMQLARDRVGMVRIFRYLDAIDAAEYNESISIGANNGQ